VGREQVVSVILPKNPTIDMVEKTPMHPLRGTSRFNCSVWNTRVGRPVIYGDFHGLTARILILVIRFGTH
jgi:hypothetical protein